MKNTFRLAALSLFCALLVFVFVPSAEAKTWGELVNELAMSGAATVPVNEEIRVPDGTIYVQPAGGATLSIYGTFVIGEQADAQFEKLRIGDGGTFVLLGEATSRQVVDFIDGGLVYGTHSFYFPNILYNNASLILDDGNLPYSGSKDVNLRFPTGVRADTIPAKLLPTRSGYTFDGWEADGPTGHTFYARWTALPRPAPQPLPKTGDFFPVEGMIALLVALLGTAGYLHGKGKKAKQN